MHVTQLNLIDFRCYTGVDLVLEPGVTAFVGPNGQGKTNLVEAIGYTAGLSSHRVAQDAPLVRVSAERAIIRTTLSRGTRVLLIEIEVVATGTNRARLNRVPVKSPREILGHLRSVLFAPEDLSLVKGDPEGRRRFLDDLLVQRAPRFAGVRQDVDRVLRQRNALLKTAGAALRSGRGDVRTLDVWDAQLAVAGAELINARLHLVHLLRPHVEAAYSGLAGFQNPAGVVYRSSLGEDVGATGVLSKELLQARLLEALARSRPQELDRGLSLVGPQRDDLTLTLGSFPAKGFASHGESWSLALALRLASYHLLREDPGADGDGEPVLILDDVFAELDSSRRDRLAGLVAHAEQVLVTAAVAQDIPEALQGSRVDVFGGEVHRVR